MRNPRATDTYVDLDKDTATILTSIRAPAAKAVFAKPRV